MKLIIILQLFIAHSLAGIIHDHDEHHHPSATSYQSLHMEHYHAEPINVKKGHLGTSSDKSYSEGKTDAEVKIHHGSKHEPGYAVGNVYTEMYGHHGGHQFVAEGGHTADFTADSSYEHDGQQYYENGEEQSEGRQYAEGGESVESTSDEGSRQHDGYATSNEEESY